MKRYILLSILMTLSLMASASMPKLASEEIFEELDLYDASLSVTIMERSDQIVRSVTFRNKPELLKKIQKALTSDKEKAVSKSLVSDNGEICESVVIINDDAEINIGLTNSKSKEVYFFMRIVPKKNNDLKKTSGDKRTKRTIKASKARKATKS